MTPRDATSGNTMKHPPALRRIFADVRRHECSLAIACTTRDDVLASIAAGRLSKALRRAAAALQALPRDAAVSRLTLSSMLSDSTRRMQALVVPTSTTGRPDDARRLARWAMAAWEAPPGSGALDVFELDGAGITLDETQFAGLHLARCRFISSLQRARFAEVQFDDCDFTYANLSKTAWQRAWINRSFLRESRLTEAAFDRTTFVDCDLRCVDFSVANPAIPTHDLVFLRCDLRRTNWTGRDLSGVTAVDCRVHQVIGIGRSSPLRVIRADVSLWGNASEMIGLEAPALYTGDEERVMPSALSRRPHGACLPVRAEADEYS